MNFNFIILYYTMVKSYYFDEEIAPLTDEEKTIMKEYELLEKKINTIYKRTDQVIRLHKKTQRNDEIRIRLQKEKERKKETEKKEKEENISKSKKLLENTTHFTENYSEFKESFYKLFNELRLLLGNFQDTKVKVIEIQNFRKKFIDKCIHPECFKTIGYYSYETHDGGGYGGPSTYEKRTCNACILCTKQDEINQAYAWMLRQEDVLITFSTNTYFDNQNNITSLFQDIEKCKK